MYVCVLLGLYWSDNMQYEGVQYAVSESRASWFDGRDTCHQDNATLAVITSADQDQYLREFCLDDAST